ncbi:hypothetical protein [Synechococcus elongatus]|uniref:hypothetical protein n=1 Tax=Synechococcus elongatus TaxID=32046 RepID=UPI000F7F111A|nr:hypothetical protein [Synechococcus elongatus]
MKKESKKTTSQENSSAADYLISLGLDGDDSISEETSIKIYLTASQENKVQDFCHVFGISARTMMNSCLLYILFLSSKKSLHPKELQCYPKRLGSREHEVTLNRETINRLKSFGITDHNEVVKCIIAGVKVLHDKNLVIRKTKPKREK